MAESVFGGVLKQIDPSPEEKQVSHSGMNQGYETDLLNQGMKPKYWGYETRYATR